MIEAVGLTPFHDGNVPTFPDRRDSVITYDRGREVLDARRHFWRETRRYQETAKVLLPGDHPITIVGISDVHLGSVYSDLDIFDRDTKIIEQVPGMYAVFLSNLVDTPLPSQYPDSMLVNPLTPHEQAEVMNERIRQLDSKGKILGMVRSPCHEGWTEKRAGIDIQRIIFMGTHIPLLENGGVLELTFPNERTYLLGLYHQFGKGYGSDINKNYGTRYQLRNIKRGNADALMIAHSHVGEVAEEWEGQHPNRKTIVLIRTGSYKGNVSGRLNDPNDIWQRDQSGRDGEPGGESVTFFPNERKMQPHLSPLSAARYQLQELVYSGIVERGKLGDFQEEIKKFRKRIGLEPIVHSGFQYQP